VFRNSRPAGSAANQSRNRCATVFLGDVAEQDGRQRDAEAAVAERRRYSSPSALRTMRALRSPRRIMASIRVRRDATSANSAATKKALAATSATMASRRRPRPFTA